MSADTLLHTIFFFQISAKREGEKKMKFLHWEQGKEIDKNKKKTKKKPCKWFCFITKKEKKKTTNKTKKIPFSFYLSLYLKRYRERLVGGV